MPGLIRGVARTAVVAGTATHVSNNVSRRQANKWANQGAQSAPSQQYAAPPQYEAPPQYVAAPAAPAEDDMLAQLEKLGQLRDAGVLTEAEFAAQKAKILAG
jgi:membrane protease subunit (stomatin/prohibitin family)